MRVENRKSNPVTDLRAAYSEAAGHSAGCQSSKCLRNRHTVVMASHRHHRDLWEIEVTKEACRYEVWE
jgi:hypothetical protein